MKTSQNLLFVALLTVSMSGSAHAAKPEIGKPAPDFSLAVLNSADSLKLSEFRGKVVLLDFWASWCLPCRKWMPVIEEIKQRHPEMEVLAVSVDIDKGKALSFLRDVLPGLKSGHDVDQKAAESYAVEGMPACFLIDKKGRLRFRHDSYDGEGLKQIEREARRLLTESGR